MNVLIVYGTSEGQTRKIAGWTATHIRDLGHTVELRDSAAPEPDANLASFDAYIVAASVHQERHQDSIVDFTDAHHELLNARASAFISVSLCAALENERAEAQKYVDHFIAETGWTPRMSLLLGGALRFSDYDYFQEQVVKFVVLKGTGDADAERDHEFTDWTALSNFVDEFLKTVD